MGISTPSIPLRTPASPIAPRSPRVARSAACRPSALPSRDGRAAPLSHTAILHRARVTASRFGMVVFSLSALVVMAPSFCLGERFRIHPNVSDEAV